MTISVLCGWIAHPGGGLRPQARRFRNRAPVARPPSSPAVSSNGWPWRAVTEPPLLVLDEPLANLDAKLRESLRFELKRLRRGILASLSPDAVHVSSSTISVALALGLKDVRLVLAAGEDLQVPLPVASLLRDRFLTLLAIGGGNLDWSAIGGLSRLGGRSRRAG
jgi:hypothetical protein